MSILVMLMQGVCSAVYCQKAVACTRTTSSACFSWVMSLGERLAVSLVRVIQMKTYDRRSEKSRFLMFRSYMRA